MNLSEIEYDVLMQAINNAKAAIADDEFIDYYSEDANKYSEEELTKALDSVEKKLVNESYDKGGQFLVAYQGQCVRLMANDITTALYQSQCDYNRPPHQRFLDWKDSEHKGDWDVVKLS